MYGFALPFSQAPARGPSQPCSRQPNRSGEAIAHVVYALCSIVLHSGLPFYLGSALPGGDAVALLKGTTRILSELSHGSATTVPDAVLKRTQCILVIQATRTPRHCGTTACRETSDRRNNPVLVTFERKAGPTRAATLFIFVLSDAAVRALRSGLLEIQTYKYP